jgi:hypothetical protein
MCEVSGKVKRWVALSMRFFVLCVCVCVCGGGGGFRGCVEKKGNEGERVAMRTGMRCNKGKVGRGNDTARHDTTGLQVEYRVSRTRQVNMGSILELCSISMLFETRTALSAELSMSHTVSAC